MPRPKGGQVKGDQLKAARQGKSEKQAIAESDTALDDLWSNFNQSKAYAEELEHKLTDQAKICTDLQNDFKAFQDLIDSLHAEILSLKSKNSDIYHQLRMERQRCKRATSKHGSMSSQILLLKKADAISSAQFSKGLRDSAVTITSLLKVNEDLRTELSQSVTTWSSRTEALTEAAKSKLMSSDTRLKNAQKEVSKLRKGFHRATQAKEMLFQQQRPRSFSKNQFTIFHTKVSSHRKPAILFVFFPNLVVQQTASIISLMLYSRQQALQWLGALVSHLLPE